MFREGEGGSETFVIIIQNNTKYNPTLFREVQAGEKNCDDQGGSCWPDDGEDRRRRGEEGGGSSSSPVLQRVHEEPGGQIQHREHRVSS